ncbi:MAG: NAD(P)H-hydrate epimerase [Candidatus Saganbacteria bacterium]|nr:NAD(P)H-hydrate epimerase [Candidatus Saganbacteria bacterium]
MKNKSITSQQAKDFDKFAQEELLIPSIVLMENAGRNTAKIASQMTSGKNIIIVCGKGNNGGDGLVAARHLINLQYNVKVYLLTNPDLLTGDAKINYEILKKMKANFEENLSALGEGNLIIDAIFGIGLSSDVKEPYESVIGQINSAGKPVLSVDVPSGLDATTGKILGCAVNATKTITFVAAKTGFYKNDGSKVCGEIVVADIGITS